MTKHQNGLTLNWRVALTRLRKARNAVQTALLLGIPDDFANLDRRFMHS